MRKDRSHDHYIRARARLRRSACLLEHHRTVPRQDAIVRARGFRIIDGFISPLDLVAIGLIPAEEAKELHELETSGAARAQ